MAVLSLTAEDDQRLRDRGLGGPRGLLAPDAPLLVASATAVVPDRRCLWSLGRRDRIVSPWCFERPGENCDEDAWEPPRFGS